ncbi:hypothetical protein SAMN04487906_3378 [Zhouia amylolytica]|uniref:Uncharacterized protein n=1 Tax=Zhouia amylolytica TaxID=376730 RepID=A0A1I6VUF8_9FLAO|nr:hypothetical protein SAMN04487906_3378 [Zhouia amylolytica]
MKHFYSKLSCLPGTLFTNHKFVVHSTIKDGDHYGLLTGNFYYLKFITCIDNRIE